MKNSLSILLLIILSSAPLAAEQWSPVPIPPMDIGGGVMVPDCISGWLNLAGAFVGRGLATNSVQWTQTGPVFSQPQFNRAACPILRGEVDRFNRAGCPLELSIQAAERMTDLAQKQLDSCESACISAMYNYQSIAGRSMRLSDVKMWLLLCD